MYWAPSGTILDMDIQQWVRQHEPLWKETHDYSKFQMDRAGFLESGRILEG